MVTTIFPNGIISKKKSGSKYDLQEYDFSGSGKEYFAAIAGIADTGNSVSLTFGATYKSYWASFNSDVKSCGSS